MARGEINGGAVGEMKSTHPASSRISPAKRISPSQAISPACKGGFH